MLSPATPASLSTLTTSSSATFSWRPPQRTIAYTRELSLSLRFPSVPQRTNVIRAGSLELAHGFPLRGQRATPDRQGYQTVRVSRTTRTISPASCRPTRGAGGAPGPAAMSGSLGRRDLRFGGGGWHPSWRLSWWLLRSGAGWWLLRSGAVVRRGGDGIRGGRGVHRGHRVGRKRRGRLA